LYDLSTTRSLLQQAGTAIANGRHADALTLYDSIVADQPNHEFARFGQATCLHALDQYPRAAEVFGQLAVTNPANLVYRYNQGYCLLLDGRYDDAAHVLRELTARVDDPRLKTNLAVALQNQSPRDLDSARALLAAAAAQLPGDADIEVIQASLDLLAGDFEAGWRRHDRRSTPFAPAVTLDLPRWNGEPLAGRTLFVWSVPGFGDTIQFVRFLRPLAERAKSEGARVVFPATAPLFRLLAQSFADLQPDVDIVRVEAPPGKFDLHCPLLGLPAVMRTSRATLPIEVPYLSADPSAVDAWKIRLLGVQGVKVGLVWGASSHRDGTLAFRPTDARRSVPDEQLAPLLDMPGVMIAALQQGEPPRAARALAGGPNFADFGPELDDFADTAALIDNHDLVVSVDTAVGHLAGALGKEVWLLNRWDTDSRWQLEGDDSPWYPTLRQYRQTRNGDWTDVVARVAHDLGARVAARAR
jgi:thioredoxin-like negative regulator of GroEL